MNSNRVFKNIFRRLSISETVNTSNTIPTQLKLFDNELSPRKSRLYTSLPKYQIRTMSDIPSTSAKQHSENRLASEKSPYLLQHATNPVDWYPWCEEAFQKAKNENKLIFLSVGYSTCHWCHVMEKESFENDSVAQIMNRYYVNIKVDREERPDIDRVYMNFIQATSGGGGWPMSVFLTPNLEPITGGTYFPPEDKWGRQGFKTILTNIAHRWEAEKDSIQESGKQIIEILKRASERNAIDVEPSPCPSLDCVERCLQQYKRSYDPEFGGFSDAPKFPQPSNFDFLFHMYSREPNSLPGKQCLNMCLHTLKRMAYGGIHDHISNGFARYSTDGKWHVPHFEKMLYDQGQLTTAYCNAYTATKNPFFADIIHDILLYVSRDLSHELGGFYSAEDADSFPDASSTHKKEGAFCVWEYDEIFKHLTDRTGQVSDAEILSYHFNVRKAGNVSPSQDPHNELTNKNVLITFGGLESTAEFFEMSVEQVQESLDRSKKILFEVRQKRPRPHLDTKILTAWNGLMISGFAKAGEVLKEDKYIDRAIKAANFIKKYLYNKEERILLRCCYRDDAGNIVQNSTPIVGFLDDYSFLIRSLVDLYEATLDASWLEWAEVLQDSQDRLFWDETNGAYYMSPEGDPTVLIRVKDDQDGAEPAGNSISAHNLLKLSAYLDRPEWKSKAERLLALFAERLQKIPIALPEMMSALMHFHDSLTNVLIIGPRDDPSTKSLINVVHSRLMPGRAIVLVDTSTTSSPPSSRLLYDRLEILKRLKMQNGQPTAYVCYHYACSLPVNQVEELEKLLDDLVKK